MWDDRLRKSEWSVSDLSLKETQRLVREHHYAGGGSNTRTFAHGLFLNGCDVAMGVAWWIPPTKAAAITVNAEWQKVLTLSRLVIMPGVPKNAASFLLSRSVKMIAKDGRFISLVTYADEGRGHTGAVYLCSGWTPAGKTNPEAQWADPATGRYVARKAGPKTRTKEEMQNLGFEMIGRFSKFKFIKHLERAA